MTSNINFKIFGYNGQESLSSYSLSSTPLLFIPETLPFENPNILWDFGDGTISRSISASKYYNFPGKYTVKIILYDCYNNPLESINTKEVIISDYFPLTFNIQTNTLNLSCGKISGPITFRAYFPHYQKPINIYYSISGSKSNNYWDIASNKHAHLDNYYSLYEKFYNYSLKSYQFSEISNIETVNFEIYGRIQDDEIKICKSTDSGAFFIGMSGQKECYIKDDSVNSLISYFYFDKTKYTIPSIQYDLNHLNNLGIRVPFTVEDNIPTQLSITSNGLGGEYYKVSSFEINPIKYYNIWVPFIVRLKDYEWFSVKTFNSIELSALSISLSANIDGITYLLNNSQYRLSSLNYTLSSQDHGGAFRGALFFNENTYPLLDVKFNVSLSASNGTTTYSFSGDSNNFNIYPLNYFDIYKHNENFDGAGTLKNITFQESLLDKNKLYDDFFASVLGDENSDHEGISKKIYERISNFVSNTQDVDVCNLEALESISSFLKYNNINEEYYKYPEKIKRLVDLLSINKNKLLGTSNKFKENFDTRGHTSKTEYGKNIGDLINTETYVINAGTDIVALEKFSNTYTRLDTYQPTNLGIWEHMCAQVDSRLVGKDPLSSSYIFEPTSLSGYRPENPDSFLYGIDKTGWSAVEFDRDQGILLTPRHIGYAAHYTGGLPPVPGRTFNFYDLSGGLSVATVLSSVKIGSTDIRIVLLSSDLPDTIKPVRIASNQFLDYLDWVAADEPRSKTPMIWRNQFRRASVIDHINSTSYKPLTAEWYGQLPTDNTRLSFYIGAISFDSGSPISFLFKDDALLVGHFYGGGPGYGPRYGSYLTEINAAISALNLNASVVGDYSLDVVNPSEVGTGKYPYYLRDYSSDWGWPLVLPTSFDFEDMGKYYLFFDYNDQYDNTILDSVVDFENTKTTTLNISVNLFKNVVQNMFLSNLYESLSLVK